MVLSGPVHAGTIKVAEDGSGLYTSLSAGVAAAGDGDTVEVYPGSYSGTAIVTGIRLTIEGVGEANEIVVESDGAGFALEVNGGASLTLSGLTLKGSGGRGIDVSGAEVVISDATFESLGDEDLNGGAVLASGSTVVIERSTFSTNSGMSGGAVYASNASDVQIVDSTFEDNSAMGGGAVAVEYDTELSITGSSFTSNVAEVDGGALALNETYTTATISDSSFANNATLQGNGGAITFNTETDVEITDSEFLSNFAYTYGGAIVSWSTGPTNLTLTRTTFLDNGANHSGGAVGMYYAYGSLTILESDFDGNYNNYSHGGAVYQYYDSSLTVDASTFTNNDAGASGGGLYHYYGVTKVTDSVFENNDSSSYYIGSGGGAYLNHVNGPTVEPATVTGCTFADNMVGYEGGGLYLTTIRAETDVSNNSFTGNKAGEASLGGGLFALSLDGLLLQQNTFSGNSARYGGGFYLANGWEPENTVTNNTVFNNQSSVGGGACIVDFDTLSVSNNTFAGNQALESGGALCIVEANVDVVNNILAYTPQGSAIEVFDELSMKGSSFRYNDFYDNTDGDPGGFLDATTLGEANHNLAVEPLFSTWTHDGDPSDDSLVLARDSALIDAGDPKILDPDGSTSDIGAYGGPRASTVDADGDGYDESSDCDDDDSAVYPGASDTWYDGVNADCDSQSDFDQDGDGVDSWEYGGTDCNDRDSTDQSECEGGSSNGAGPVEPSTEKSCACGGGGTTGGLALWAVCGLLARRRRS